MSHQAIHNNYNRCRDHKVTLPFRPPEIADQTATGGRDV
jgi:hypothetical protein